MPVQHDGRIGRVKLAMLAQCHSVGFTNYVTDSTGVDVAITSWLVLRNSSTRQQVDDQDNQRNHQQQVNEAAGHVKAEPQKPENQKHYENCPKHV